MRATNYLPMKLNLTNGSESLSVEAQTEIRPGPPHTQNGHSSTFAKNKIDGINMFTELGLGKPYCLLL